MAPLAPLLSLDPASTKIGWALLNPGPAYLNSGVCLIPKVAAEERVPYVGDTVTQIICQCRPASVLIEVPDFIAQWAKPHIVWFFRAVGVAEYVAHQHRLPIYRVNASTDNDKHRKTNGIAFFRQITGRPPLQDDESDALVNGWKFLTQFPPPLVVPASCPQTHADSNDWGEDQEEDPDAY